MNINQLMCIAALHGMLISNVMLGPKSAQYRQRIRENGTVYDLDVKKGRRFKTILNGLKHLVVSFYLFFFLRGSEPMLLPEPGAQASKLRRALPEDGHDRRSKELGLDCASKQGPT